MKEVKHIFFDLDHTIWDFEKNSSETLRELFQVFGLDKKIDSVDNFIEAYQRINADYWRKYRTGEVTKDMVRTGRFMDTLVEFEVDNPERTAKELGEQYIQISPKKTALFPYTHETLTYLGQKYPLHIITNGFSEVVDIKLSHSKLKEYFDVVVCAEDLGHKKPHPHVFQSAIEKARTNPAESVMIGDNYEVDIIGADKCGMKTIFFNPKREENAHRFVEIQCLSELRELL